ncbi:retinoic acid receptor responder protein 2 [Bombina bombina]|uniref:retinoic acid receptor responder protein 2 n=1 Tax=Bombina bombina TaxID=8345 RepID=UPI00235A53D5|nr:retinoic acid receptor responder protein 2 [Bombina bombina]
MKTLVVPLWMISTALALAVNAQIAVEDLSAVQDKVLTLVMQDFHSKDNIKNGFKLTSLLEETELDFSAGKFVHLNFTAKQTACKRDNWKSDNCKVIKTGRTFSCFSCFKLEHGSHKVISKFVDCIPERHLIEERNERRRKYCKEVEGKKEQGLGLPGMVSFSMSN